VSEEGDEEVQKGKKKSHEGRGESEL